MVAGPTPIKISNCRFVGVEFNKEATEAISTIASALLENSKALGQLSSVLKASNVTVETMLKVNKEEQNA